MNVEGMGIIKVRLTGVSPLLMHSPQGANPLDPLAKELKKITGKKKKTDEDHQKMSDLDWQLGIYYDEEIGPFMPAENIDKCLVEGGKNFKLGTTILKSCTTMPYRVPLEYDGPRDFKALMESSVHRDSRGVKIGGRSTVIRTRPRFNRWALEFDVHFKTEAIDWEDVVRSLEAAGRYCSLGDYRPRYGQFEVEVINIKELKKLSDKVA